MTEKPANIMTFGYKLTDFRAFYNVNKGPKNSDSGNNMII